MPRSVIAILAVFCLTLSSCVVGNGPPGSASSFASSSSITSSAPAATSEVEVTTPPSGALVQSPLTVTGRAKGGWFFEGSLPVALVDESGASIAEAPGRALDEWTAPDWVRFKTTLMFTTASKNGWLVIRKDNPSGLAENDGEVRISVRFK